MAQQKPQVESRRVNDQALENVLVATQVRAAHPTGFVQVGVAAFHPFPTQALQTLAPRAADSPAVRGHGLLGFSLTFPATRSTIRLRHVRPNPQYSELFQALVAVITLVRHRFLKE